MHIYIASIDKQSSQQGSNIGYRVTFRSNLTYGTALLVDSRAVAPSLCGQEIFVEVEAEEIQEVRVLSAEEAHEYSFAALPQEGCYQVVGKVVYAPPVDADEDPVIGVGVDDAFFFLPNTKNSNLLPLETWVSFKALGLSLWDMNL